MQMVSYLLASLLLLASFTLQAANRCKARHLSKIETQVCASLRLKYLDEALNNTYKKTLTVVANKQKVIHQQYHWLHAVQNKCPEPTV